VYSFSVGQLTVCCVLLRCVINVTVRLRQVRWLLQQRG